MESGPSNVRTIIVKKRRRVGNEQGGGLQQKKRRKEEKLHNASQRHNPKVMRRRVLQGGLLVVGALASVVEEVLLRSMSEACLTPDNSTVNRTLNSPVENEFLSFEVKRSVGSERCRTTYFDRLLAKLERDPRRGIRSGNIVGVFSDVDTAMASWPDMNAALLDEASWKEGSKQECYPWSDEKRRQELLTRLTPALSDEAPLVFFNFAAPFCKEMDADDVDCSHYAIDDPRVVQVVTSAHADAFRKGMDVAWPLVPNDNFIDKTRNFRTCEERPIFVSFVGTATHSVRFRLRDALLKEENDVVAVVRDPKIAKSSRNDRDLAKRARSLGCDRIEDFNDSLGAAPGVMGCSKFVVAPRGHSLHSSRLLEAMAAGAVPVVVSDNWVLPFEHDDLLHWDDLVVRIPEAAVDNITNILRAITPKQYCAMVRQGHRAWTQHFSTVERSVDTLLSILAHRKSDSLLEKTKEEEQHLYDASDEKNDDDLENEDYSASFLELPSFVDSVLLNIGSSSNPVLPDPNTASVLSLAFEPILEVVGKIAAHEKLLVVPAAVSSFDGLRTMRTYNTGGVSSSLGRAATTDFWNDNKTRGDGRQVVVPVLSLKTVLSSLPLRVEVPYLKTDMQGADFAAIESLLGHDLKGINMLRRIPYILTEVWLQNEQSYLGFHNDLCRNWLPLMDAAGYKLVYIRVIESNELRNWPATELDDWSQAWAYNPHLQCDADLNNEKHTRRPGLFEADVHWIRNDTFHAILYEDIKPKRPPVESDFDWPLFF